MKRLLVGISLLILGVAVGFGLGWCVWGRWPMVRVTVRNDSRKIVAAARVEHEGGVEVIENLECGGTRTVWFLSPSETSYRLKVDFADATRVEGTEEYAEPGYRFTEVITDSAVETRMITIGRY